MKRLSIILIINFIFTCTLHAGTTYFSPDGKVVSKQQFEILQKEHSKKVQAAREKRKADALTKQASQKKINTNLPLDRHGKPIPLDQFGRPIKTPDGNWITYPDQERHDIPPVTVVGHDDATPSSAGNKSNKSYNEHTTINNEGTTINGEWDTRGTHYTPAGGGNKWRQDGTFMQKAAGGYIDTKTGRFVPAN